MFHKKKQNLNQQLLPGFFKSLSARLLLFTALFVMIAEVFAFAPSIGRAQRDYFLERLSAAHLAILALEASGDQPLTDDLKNKLLDYAGAKLIAFRMESGGRLALIKDVPNDMAVTIDLQKNQFFGRIIEAFRTLFADKPYKTLRVLGSSPQDKSGMLEVVMSEEPLVIFLRSYAWRIFFLSLAISLFTATLVFASLHFFFAKPVRTLTESIIRFREDPEDLNRAITTTNRVDEIGIAQNELSGMQEAVRNSLQQQSRLAALGTGVAKINHDLRNMLATTLLLSERLEESGDSQVRKMAPKFISSIERAVNICSNTLRFAQDNTPVFNPTTFSLFGLVDEVGEQKVRDSSQSFEQVMTWNNQIDLRLAIEADYDHLFRVIDNLVRNAHEAGAKKLDFLTHYQKENLILTIRDNGPGLPDKAKDNLFQPFSVSSKKGGTGLGLVIARDNMRSFGGDLQLEESGPKGTKFQLIFPSSSLR